MTVYSKIFLSVVFAAGLFVLQSALAQDTPPVKPAAPSAAPTAPVPEVPAYTPPKQDTRPPPPEETVPIHRSSKKDEPQFYVYANNEAEYSVALPEAPTVETIWAGEGEIPYIENPPQNGSVGEVAHFKRVNMETEDFFEVTITYLKANRNFLLSLNEEKIKETLQNELKKDLLNDAKFTYSANPEAGSLKWAALTGFTIAKNNQPLFHAMHYLTGQQSILVVKVVYNIDDPNFQGYYKNLIENITYHAP